jgi:hypothetical protein
MASPFRTFRKYQKTLIAVAGVVLMFVFVLGDPLSQMMNGSNAPTGTGLHPTDVAVKWDGGQLTNAEVDQLVIQRRVVNNFIRNVEGVGRMRMAEQGLEPQPLRVEAIIGPERPQEGVERDVLRMRLFADAARNAGMAISDDHIVNYLQQLGRGIVSVEDIRQILAGVQVGNRRTSTDFVLDALREEMLARNYMASYVFAFDTNLPEQRYQDWLNVNDRVVVEAAAIPAESLLADVPEPTDKELQEFYDQYKDLEPMPDRTWGIELPSPNPGFAIPRKIAVQYLLAEFSQFLAKVEDSVTEEEIAKFYEDNKDPYFISASSVLSDADDATAPATDADKPADGATTEEKATDEKPADDKPADAAVPATNDESSTLRTNPFRLTAIAQDTPAGGEATPATETPATDAAAPSEAPEAAEPAEAAGATQADEADEKPKEFQPLDEVRDQIRREIAQIKVSEQLEALMGKLQGELNESYTEYFGAALDAEAEGKEVPPPPAKLADLTEMAKANSLVYQKTDPASMIELRETAIGKSVRPDENNMPFYYSIFGRDVERFAPIATYDLDNNRYLAMKTDDIAGKVPKLDEVREKVIRAWKIRKAGELAQKKAEELAKKAQETGASLTDTFVDDPNVKVVKTDPFSFLTVGTVSRDTQQVESFRLSEPEGIIAAGPEFMEKVFGLKEGEVAAAPNHDDSVVYIVKIAEHQNSPAELQQAFLAEADTWYGIGAMSRGRAQTAVRVMLAEMVEDAGVDWLRDPDVPLQEETEVNSDAAVDDDAKT